MSQPDAFALQNSGFNAFLFAEAGTEENGSPLTVLSILARLGKDPWAQAAEWAKLPNAAGVDGLTDSLAQMPLCARDLAGARITSGRLIRLLPHSPGHAAIGTFKMPEWIPIAVFGVILGLAVIAGSFATAPATTTQPAAPATETQR